ncbi:MAG: hypothetical protein ACYSWQ_18000, partial [Planctomycetota bacterium]
MRQARRLLMMMGIAATVAHTCVAGDQARVIRLPGARAAIDASHYPSIQAAFDALPAEGGVVNLPPGTFEINEPLKISKGDVLIKGAGTATHIKNVNTMGKSALILQHPGAGDNRKSELWRIRLA